MKPILRIACVCGMLWGILWAQSPAPESLAAWQYYKELQSRGTMARFMLDRDVLDRARTDAADLRLYDDGGHEIPYELTIRRDVDTHSLFTSRDFNRAVEGATALVSCDLGGHPQLHNEVQISTAGDNFRRMAEVDGSADGAQWVTLASQAILFRFSSGGRTVEQNSVNYPPSSYRYIRVRVERDPQVDRAAPEISSLGVLRAIHMKGETLSFEATMESREADPYQGRPASIWRVDLGGRIPLQSLELNVGERTFSRPFVLEILDDPAAPALLASGDLSRNEENAAAPTRIDFSERFARRLKLTVTDDRNPPLSINSVRALGAAREVVFMAPHGVVRLYYGNPKGIAPHYDLSSVIPADRMFQGYLTLGPERPNPIYRPEPKPLSERSPWLVYIVLIGACAALAAILVNLARTSARIAAAEHSPRSSV
jgi:hypothetical protein